MRLKQRIAFFCKDCNLKLIPINGHYSIYYGCPRHLEENRNYTGTPCNVRLSCNDIEKIAEKAENALTLGEYVPGYSGNTQKMEYRYESHYEAYDKFYVWKKSR